MRYCFLLAAAFLVSQTSSVRATGPYDDYACTQALAGFQYALAAHQHSSADEYPLTYNAVYFAYAAYYHAEMGRATDVPEYFTYAYQFAVYGSNYAGYSYSLTGNLDSARARVFLDDCSLQSIGAFDDHNRRRGGGGATELRVEGTLVQNVAGNSVTIRQSNGNTVTVIVTAATEFERNGAHVNQTALRVGDFAEARYGANRVATKVESSGP